MGLVGSGLVWQLNERAGSDDGAVVGQARVESQQLLDHAGSAAKLAPCDGVQGVALLGAGGGPQMSSMVAWPVPSRSRRAWR